MLDQKPNCVETIQKIKPSTYLHHEKKTHSVSSLSPSTPHTSSTFHQPSPPSIKALEILKKKKIQSFPHTQLNTPLIYIPLKNLHPPHNNDKEQKTIAPYSKIACTTTTTILSAHEKKRTSTYTQTYTHMESKTKFTSTTSTLVLEERRR